MDFHDHGTYMQKQTQWRLTPPKHWVVALHEALAQYQEEGGLAARGARYQANCQALTQGMTRLGLRPYLPAHAQAPIIVTFHAPQHAAYDFLAFYQGVRDRGFILYPGKLTQIETFRVGCIGALTPQDLVHWVAPIASTLVEMGVLAAP